jgi:transcriptional regulatory protein LEU3
MFVSLAKVTCMQLGLHRPEAVQDFLRVKTTFGPKEFQEAVKIWAGCFISAQR